MKKNLICLKNNFFRKMIRIMKISSFLLFVVVFQSFASNNYAQNKKLTLSMDQVTIAHVLQAIQDQSEFKFFYNDQLVDVSKKVTVTARKKDIWHVLDQILPEAGITYRVVGMQVALFNANGNKTYQQKLVVSGEVTDEKGNPLPGVNIVERGSTNGTITDEKGKYTIQVDPSAILVFSFIGYKTQEVPVAGKKLINVTMVAEEIGLEEVVTIGYGTSKKISLTGSVTSVKADKLETIPTSNLSNLLEGRAPGVQIINNSGFVGATSSIEIRGKGSWNNEPPLYVIDNIVVSKSDFDALDPNEVSSISFLKDAATASIYGARASGGVVLVSTKKGRNQKPRFNFKGTYTFQEPTRPLQNYTATQELTYWNDKMETLGHAKPWGPEIFDYFKDKSYNVNDYIWHDPSSQQYNLSVNGGSEAITYFMMVGTNLSKGSYVNTDYDRYNFRSNVTARINKYMDINLNLSGNQRMTDRFYWPYDGMGRWQTVSDFYRTTFNWSRLFPFFVDENGNPTTDQSKYPVVGSGGWNPVLMVNGGSYRKITERALNGIFRFNLKIPWVDGLKTSFMVNYTTNDLNWKNLVLHNKAYRFQRASTDNPFIPAPVDPNQMVVHNLSSPFERIDEIAGFSHSYQLDWFLNYDHTFDKHTVSGMLVYEQQEAEGKHFNGTANQLLSRSVDQIFNTSKDPEKRWFDGYEYASARESWIGRAHYEYDQKYIVEFSFRYDGSYKFPKDTRWGFFPSGSAAWLISRENFFDVSFISNLKVRFSVGTAGNDAVSAFQFQNNFVSGASYIFGGTLYNGIKAGVPPNPSITWEKSITYDGGIDFGFFDNKLTGAIDGFYRYSWDILGRRIRVIPGTYGARLSSENYGKMDVRGVDFVLNYNGRAGKFRYYVGYNMGYAKDKVVYIDEPEGLEPWRSAMGHPLNRHWGLISEGIIRDQETLDNLPSGFTQYGRTPMLGVILYKDIRGENRTPEPDGKIDNNDYDWLSENAKPRINYGVTLGGSWKGISVDMLFQGVGAYDKMVATQNTPHGGVFQAGNRPYFELWTKHWSPEHPDAPYPRASAAWGKPEYGWGPSTFWMRNGAYLRFKNLNLAYSLPKSWLTHAMVETLQIFFNGTNLFVITGFKEHDPEQATLDSYPIMRSYTFGMNLTF